MATPFRRMVAIATDVDIQPHGPGVVVVVVIEQSDNDNDNDSLPDGISVTTSIPIAPSPDGLLPSA
jgi:hypothetical protein